MFAAIRTSIFGIATSETSVTRRGFRCKEPQVAARLETIGRSFLNGYHAALKTPEPLGLSMQLDESDGELRGFAYEGAAMALTLQDLFSPFGASRLHQFLRGPGAAHIYMVHVGAGWALARVPWHRHRCFERLDPLLRWLAIDGCGFHEGYFKWSAAVRQQKRPRWLRGYACRAFDQGLGRSLWFVEGADPAQIGETISAFPTPRQADLWSGVGLACAYAGGVNEWVMAELPAVAKDFQPCLAQGAAFAAKARQLAGNPSSHTELACLILCNCSAAGAASVTDAALVDLPVDGYLPSYEIWRQRIRVSLVHRSASKHVQVAPG